MNCLVWKLPSSAEEGTARQPRAGAPGAKRKRDSAQPQELVLVKQLILLNSTTRRLLLRLRPVFRLRAIALALRVVLALRCGCPPQLRRAVSTPDNSFTPS